MKEKQGSAKRPFGITRAQILSLDEVGCQAPQGTVKRKKLHNVASLFVKASQPSVQVFLPFTFLTGSSLVLPFFLPFYPGPSSSPSSSSFCRCVCLTRDRLLSGPRPTSCSASLKDDCNWKDWKKRRRRRKRRGPLGYHPQPSWVHFQMTGIRKRRKKELVSHSLPGKGEPKTKRSFSRTHRNWNELKRMWLLNARGPVGMCILSPTQCSQCL